MKKTKSFRVDDLFVDVVEYAFTEWLVRRGIFSAFRSNFVRVRSSEKSFRYFLRDHIRFVRCSSYFGLGSLIDTAFLFTSTPEGYEFWLKHSDAWRRFFIGFLKKC